jgi:hypothetical protein
MLVEALVDAVVHLGVHWRRLVSAAQLAWSVCADLQKRSAKPVPQVVARRVRVELADQAGAEVDAGVRDRVIDIVVAETLPPDEE